MLDPPTVMQQQQTIADPKLATLTRRVLVVSGLAALVVILGTIVDCARGGYAIRDPLGVATTVFWLAVALAVPCCGYFGAKRSDSSLMCCFCGCSCFRGFAGIFMAIWLVHTMHSLRWVVEHCHPAIVGLVRQPDCPDRDGWKTLCTALTSYPDSLATLSDCYDKLHETYVEGFAVGMAVPLAFLIPALVLACLGFLWGSSLHSELKRGAVLHAPVIQFSTQPAAVQVPARQV